MILCHPECRRVIKVNFQYDRQPQPATFFDQQLGG